MGEAEGRLEGRGPRAAVGLAAQVLREAPVVHLEHGGPVEEGAGGVVAPDHHGAGEGEGGEDLEDDDLDGDGAVVVGEGEFEGKDVAGDVGAVGVGGLWDGCDEGVHFESGRDWFSGGR